MPKFQYTAIVPKQSDQYQVFSFCAKATEILQFARIDRIGRQQDGSLKGFQRPQVAGHIKEIRAYLSQDNAVLPNAIVIAFTKGITVKENKNGTALVSITNSAKVGPHGLVVDGQQRLTALSGLGDKDFEVLVSCILCENEEELRKQFILINNTKPLPKQLIYELLPTVDGLPHRLSSRSTAAKLVEMLNYNQESSLQGQIKQHTNPSGILQDTVIQKLIMGSLNDGALREISRGENGLDRCYQFLSNYFEAVQSTFSEAWDGHKPKTSRLIHSVGLTALGFVMEFIHTTTGATTAEQFNSSLKKLNGKCAWTDGVWEFGEGNHRPWNGLQGVSRDYMELTHYLLANLKDTPNI